MTKTSVSGSEPITIKKYANRRLYNTDTSTYVTLEDLAEMVKSGADFVVFDAKSGDDITRSVLTQIIFEEESKGQNLLPIKFLRQLIRFYGDSMQSLVPSYLEFSMDSLTREQDGLREQLATTFGGQTFEVMEEQVRQNMEMFESAMGSMFAPFTAQNPLLKTMTEPLKPAGDSGPKSPSEMDALREQLSSMQKQLDDLAKKE